MYNILDLISGKGFIMVNKGLAKTVGLNAAVIYGELVSTYTYWKENNGLTEHEGKWWFYCTIEDLEEKTTLKRDAQDKAIKALVKEGLIEVKRFGLPAKRYFHVTDKYVETLFANYFAEKPQTDNDAGSGDQNPEKSHHNQIAENPQTGVRENDKLDYGFSAANNKRINNNRINKKQINNNLSIYPQMDEIDSQLLRGLLTKKTDRLTDDKISVIKDLANDYLPLFEAIGLSESQLAHVVIRCLDYPNGNFRNYLRAALESELTSSHAPKADKSDKAEQAPVRKEMLPDWFNDYKKQLEQPEEKTESQAETSINLTYGDLKRMKNGEIPFDERINQIPHLKRLYDSL
jgi:DNA-binding PadR family transcriptional regulator